MRNLTKISLDRTFQSFYSVIKMKFYDTKEVQVVFSKETEPTLSFPIIKIMPWIKEARMDLLKSAPNNYLSELNFITNKPSLHIYSDNVGKSL